MDKGFQVGCFKTHMERIGIAIGPVPPGIHSKNNIESKERVIRSIYLKLKDAAEPEHDAIKASYKAVSISNELYGNDTMSVFELANGFTKPLDFAKSHTEIPEGIRSAHDKLQAKRKMSLILKSKAVKRNSGTRTRSN